MQQGPELGEVRVYVGPGERGPVVAVVDQADPRWQSLPPILVQVEPVALALARGDLKRAYRLAARIARSQKENPDFVSLPGPSSYPTIDTYVDDTARLTPRQRAMKVRSVIREAEKHKVDSVY